MTVPALAPVLKGILFDMDGTLADTEELHRQAFNLAFREFQLPWAWSAEEYHDLLSISGGRERIRRYLKSRQPASTENDLETLAADVHLGKSRIYRDLLAHAGMQLRPGVRRLVDEAAAAGIAMAIATNSSRRNVETLIAATFGTDGISRFQAVVTCDEVPEKKPDPAVYRRALAQLGLRADECLVIEDTRNGNLAALAAGLQTIITVHRFTTDNDFSGAALVLDHLGEPGHLPRVLHGKPPSAGFVNLDALRAIHAHRAEAQPAPGRRSRAAG